MGEPELEVNYPLSGIPDLPVAGDEILSGGEAAKLLIFNPAANPLDALGLRSLSILPVEVLSGLGLADSGNRVDVVAEFVRLGNRVELRIPAVTPCEVEDGVLDDFFAIRKPSPSPNAYIRSSLENR